MNDHRTRLFASSRSRARTTRLRRVLAGLLAVAVMVGLAVVTPSVAQAQASVRPAGVWLQFAGTFGDGAENRCLDVELPKMYPVLAPCSRKSTTQTWIINKGKSLPTTRQLRNEATGMCIGNSRNYVVVEDDWVFQQTLIDCSISKTWWREQYDRVPGDEWIYFSNADAGSQVYFLTVSAGLYGPLEATCTKDCHIEMNWKLKDPVPARPAWRKLDLWQPPTGGGVPKPGSSGSCGFRACQAE